MYKIEVVSYFVGDGGVNLNKRKKGQAVAMLAASAVVVSAVGVSANEGFSDVPASHVYYEAIELLAAENIISGFGDGTFKPDAFVTRGQAAKMLAGTLKLDMVTVKDPGFKEIKPAHQYYGAIAALANAGYVNGYADNTYRPSSNLTHKNVATIMSNLQNITVEQAIQLVGATGVSYKATNKVTRGEFAAILSLLMQKPPVEQPAETFDLTVLHVNDTHAHVEAFPKLMTAVEEQRKLNPDALLLHGGDVFSGTLYFNEFEGAADGPFLNAMKFDAMVLGNHEFDLGGSAEGHKALVDFIRASQFPFITANVDFAADSRFTGLFTDLVSSEPENGKIYAGMVKEIDGEKVGIFGLTTEATKEIAFVGSVKFENYIEEAKKAVAAFEGMGVNKIIALTHLGFDDTAAVDNDQELAKRVDGIDIIVGGHTHTKLDGPFIVNTNTVGQAKDRTLIVQANEYGKYLGTLDVTFDDEGVVVAHEGELLEVAKFADSEKALALLAPFKQQVDAISNSEIGVTLKETLVNPRTDAGVNGPSVRNSETVLGNIITDGMLKKAQQFSANPVVLAVQNGGGIRSDIPAGNITVGQVITVLPFGNTLSLVNVTGAELKEVFEISVAKAPEENGGFLHISGGKLTYDSSKPTGSRVTSLQYFDKATNSYVDIKDTNSYTIATNAFTAKGGDGYDVLANVYAEGRVTELGLSDWENLVQQFESLQVIPTKTESRITDIAK